MSRSSLVAVVLAALLLGACSNDDPQPNIADPTPSVSSDPSTTATPSPTVSPAASLGPEDTVRAWVDAWNDALTTGDTAAVRAFDAPSCRGCDELIGPVEQISSAGGAFEGGLWSVDGLKVVSSTVDEAKANLGVDVAPGATTQSAGASPTSYPATKHLLSFTLVPAEDQWRVSVIEVLS